MCCWIEIIEIRSRSGALSLYRWGVAPDESRLCECRSCAVLLVNTFPNPVYTRQGVNKRRELKGLDWRMFKAPVDPDVGSPPQEVLLCLPLRRRTCGKRGDLTCHPLWINQKQIRPLCRTKGCNIDIQTNVVSPRCWQSGDVSLLPGLCSGFGSKFRWHAGRSWTHWVMRPHASDWPAFVYLQAVILKWCHLQPCHAKH